MGAQYRSAIFFTTPEQEKTALAVKAALAASGAYRKPIATQIAPLDVFWRAEDYHQQYYEKQGIRPARKGS